VNSKLSGSLIDWYKSVARDLPWRLTKDPYPVWISEVILQQTRVVQGLPYYYRFIERFPNVRSLASADEQEVLKLWEGLGYYSRARNLHAGAKYIAIDKRGVFPASYDSLLKVKGIGPYTAAAIASICFDQATPVLDGNVYRVASRFAGIFSDISESKSRPDFMLFLNEFIDRANPGDFNQAMMELGATVCTPTSPKCHNCVLNSHCYAKSTGEQSSLPVKTKKVKVRNRYFHYLIFQHDSKIGLRQREAGDVWQGLNEFALLEQTDTIEPKQLQDFGPRESSKWYIHLLTHQRIHAQFHRFSIEDTKTFAKLMDTYALTSYSAEEVLTLPKSKLMVNYLTETGF
jgi:A/G-specific adenine glycosylase